MSDPALNIAALDSQEWDAFMAGYRSGYMLGLEAGRQHERDEVAALQRHAAEIVHALADVPARDVVEDRRQAEKRGAYWAARRGEVA